MRAADLPHEGAFRWSGVLVLLVTVIALMAVYLPTAAPGITWANYGADGGDFVAAVSVWGVPHPAGYPTYVLLGRLFLLVPLGDPAYRLTLMSAVGMATACGLLAWLAASQSSVGGWKAGLVGIATGSALGLAPIPWSQAVIVEVHALNLLFVILALACLAHLDAGERPGFPPVLVLGLLCGLALGNHLTFFLLLPAVFFAVWRSVGDGEGRKIIIWAVGLLLGLGVYLYLPLAARSNPPVNWGDASTWEGFRWVVTGGPYKGLTFGLPLSAIPQRVAAWAGLLLKQFGPVGLVFGAIGLFHGRSRVRWIDQASYWIVPAYSIFALGYDTADSLAYLIPAYMGFAWWMCLGLTVVTNRLADLRCGLGYLPIGLMLAALLLRVPGTAEEVDVSKDHRAVDFIAHVEKEAPQSALVLASGTEDTFALWYAHFALGQRPDLHVVVAPLAQFEWYRRGLHYTYPNLILPESGQAEVDKWVDELLSVNKLPVCRTSVTGELEELSVDFVCEQSG